MPKPNAIDLRPPKLPNVKGPPPVSATRLVAEGRASTPPARATLPSIAPPPPRPSSMPPKMRASMASIAPTSAASVSAPPRHASIPPLPLHAPPRAMTPDEIHALTAARVEEATAPLRRRIEGLEAFLEVLERRLADLRARDEAPQAPRIPRVPQRAPEPPVFAVTPAAPLDVRLDGRRSRRNAIAFLAILGVVLFASILSALAMNHA